MPPLVAPYVDDLRSTLRASLPNIGQSARDLIDYLVSRGAEGVVTSSVEIARRFGLRSRHQLGRLLRAEGLPQIEELNAWITTLICLAAWEGARVSLCRQALQARREPGTYYRTIQRATGFPWGEVRELGLSYSLLRFVERCGRRSAARPQIASARAS